MLNFLVMWILVFFDLPTDTKKDRKIYARFRKAILANGFKMLQYSMYIRHCSSRDKGEVYLRRIKRRLSDRGMVGIMSMTDKQFNLVEIFQGKDRIDNFIALEDLIIY